MKKNISLLLLLNIVCLSMFAQTETTLKKANKLFKMKAYSEAIVAYEANEHTQEMLQNLGDCYYYTAQMEKAVKVYQELESKFGEFANKDYEFRYGQALKGINKYAEADVVLEQYYGKPQNTAGFLEFLNKNTPHVFKEKLLENKNGSSDFGLTYFGDNKVVFSSARNTDSPLYSWNNLPYLDLYSATLTENGKLENVTPFSDAINTNSHESNAALTRNGKTMYFNRTNKKRSKIDGEKIANIKIYKADLVDNQWTNVQALSFTNDDFSTEHPTLSKDEKTLYFASDMPGGLGSFDIYKVEIKADGTFGEPINLGPNVNTSQREQFPFISDYNVLYFSSNGHQGLGGLDVFRSEMVNDQFTSALNLGTVVNSSLDDFGYVIKENNDKGFFSSNRSGSDQLYSLSREENILTKYLVSGIVKDKFTDILLPGSLVTLFDESGTVLQDTIVKENAHYLFKIEPNKKYKVRGTRKLYIPYDVEFSTDSQGKISHDILLGLESYEHAEEKITANERGQVQVDLEKIYFDFNKWNIRDDAAQILNTLVDLMTKYPEMEIEVSAHTDARGPNEYNLTLSKKRAASTLEYLVSRGIDKNRLKSIGYGEEQPLNKCVEEGICDDEEYDINRRCEFTLLN